MGESTLTLKRMSESRVSLAGAHGRDRRVLRSSSFVLLQGYDKASFIISLVTLSLISWIYIFYR